MQVVITGGAGYIGSMLTGLLLQKGHNVTVIDKMLFGGEHMLPYQAYGKNFHLVPEDILNIDLGFYFGGVDVVVHLAALVGFPICQQVGDVVAKKYNIEGTEKAFNAANECNVERFVFASTYSNYGTSPDGEPVTEESPLNPQSLYAETKIAGEQLLLADKSSTCKPIIFRFATLFGISPRTRLDLIINQFTFEALTKRKLIIYQKDYRRSFCHVFDTVRAICTSLEFTPDLFDYQIYNVGSNDNNYSKQQVVDRIKNFIIEVTVEYKDLTFGGDLRDIIVSFDKFAKTGYILTKSVDEGILEVTYAIQKEIIKDPFSDKYRNAKFIVS